MPLFMGPGPVVASGMSIHMPEPPNLKNPYPFIAAATGVAKATKGVKAPKPPTLPVVPKPVAKANPAKAKLPTSGLAKINAATDLPTTLLTAFTMPRGPVSALSLPAGPGGVAKGAVPGVSLSTTLATSIAIPTSLVPVSVASSSLPAGVTGPAPSPVLPAGVTTPVVSPSLPAGVTGGILKRGMRFVV
ncbi:hypothetical protein EJ04DRAFT_507519 [Polyplosphaeria fusca]|uniref:Uncharacterized protein n=1 Tax=Polyplosphaeria fusca TaxID=682080 RepID=A0A9P4RCI6_9PLEO|nr:hypothetical protein EJ04DRAFT_507519 [Polyplosphaeria fusca]